MCKSISFIIIALLHFNLLSEDRLAVSAYTHFNSEPELAWWKSGNHNKEPIIISYDRFYSDSNFYGLALFYNSFGQFSKYIYIKAINMNLDSIKFIMNLHMEYCMAIKIHFGIEYPLTQKKDME